MPDRYASVERLIWLHKRSCNNRPLTALKQLSIALAPMLLQHLVGKHALRYAPAPGGALKTDRTRSNSTPVALTHLAEVRMPMPEAFHNRQPQAMSWSCALYALPCLLSR